MLRNSTIRTWAVFGGLVAGAAAALVGCGKTQPPSEKAAEPHKDGDHKDGDHKGGGVKGEAHEHKPGPHGGTIVSLGKDSYHAEAVFEKDGAVRLYTLGKDETTAQAVEVQELVGHVTAVGATDPVQVKFAAQPQTGDAAGKTTLFVAKLPAELQGKKIKVTVNNIQVGAERFRIEFANDKGEKGGHDH